MRSPPSRPSARRRKARRCSRPGSIWRSCSAATASPDRSWPPLRCSRRYQRPRIPISIRRCRGTSAAAARIRGSARPSSRQRRRRPPPTREADMARVSRRGFLTAGAAAGGGLLLGWHLDAGARGLAAAAKGKPSVFAPNAFIRIGSDGRVTLVMCQVEMGQGTYTSMPMLLAEELEVGLDQVRLEHAPPDDKLYANPIFGDQETGASTSVRVFYEPLRRAGATARTMLVAAAAAAWKVDPASCRARKGVVTHSQTGRTLTYGALADKAAGLPVPASVTLKDPKDFKLIGTPAKRLDTPAKVNGTAQFGIDVRLPGMKVATV